MITVRGLVAVLPQVSVAMGRRFRMDFQILSVAPNQQVGGKNANADDEVPADRENQ